MYFELKKFLSLHKFLNINFAVPGEAKSKIFGDESPKTLINLSFNLARCLEGFRVLGLSFILSICILLSRAIYCLSEIKQMKNKMFHVWRELDVAHMTGGKQGCSHITHASLKEKTRGAGRQETIISNSHC